MKDYKIYEIIYEPSAKNNLDEILLYYASLGGFILAESISNQISLNIEKLEFMPTRCPISSFSSSIRKLVIKNLPLVAYFEIIDDKVYILEILHTSRKESFLYKSNT